MYLKTYHRSMYISCGTRNVYRISGVISVNYNSSNHGTRVVKWASLKSWCFGFAGSNPARDTCSYSSVG